MIEIGDLVKYLSPQGWKYGIVVHTGDWKGHGFPEEALWCVWETSPEQAEKSFKDCKKDGTLVPPIESGRLTYSNYEVTVVRPVKKLVEKKKERFDAVIEETTENIAVGGIE